MRKAQGCTTFLKQEGTLWLIRGSILLGVGILLGALLGMSTTAEAATATRVQVKQIIIEEASRTNVPVDLALAVAKVESDFNPRAKSSVGARGVMQIMPQTARGEFGLHPDKLWDARTNVRTGVKFLSQLHKQYGHNWERALSHYNGGTLKGNRPHSYTKSYVQSVMKWRRVYDEQAAIWQIMNTQHRIAKAPYTSQQDEPEIPVPDVDIFADDNDNTNTNVAALDIEEWDPSSRTVVLQEQWSEPQTEELEVVEVVLPDPPKETVVYEYEYTRPARRAPPLRYGGFHRPPHRRF